VSHLILRTVAIRHYMTTVDNTMYLSKVSDFSEVPSFQGLRAVVRFVYRDDVLIR
jgi:hypothetical protein